MLAERFQGARSIEDVVDDTAAETLFGEDFSQIAAAISTMIEAEKTDESANDAAPDQPADDEAATSKATPTADTGTDEAAASIELQATVVQVEQVAAPDPTPRQAPAAASSPTPGLASSAAERLEMVRALNRKAGKPIPPPPMGFSEEIILGENTGTQSSEAQPERIEDQFGLSMTNKLKTLSEECIRKMQHEEEQQTKRGFLSRFRRSS